MKKKKLIGVLIALVCVVVCLIVVLARCSQDGKQPDVTTEPENTEQQTTVPVTTEPETTEETTTEPETTEEVTEPETTVPATQPSSNQGASGNAGGGYTPVEPETTEPPTTEPEIQVPEAGSESNPYVEQTEKKTATFTTVNIPGNGAVFYKLQTAGSYLIVQDANAAIELDGKTYQPEDGTLKMELSGDKNEILKLRILNNSKDETSFTVKIQDAQGTKDNPIAAELGAVTGTLESGNTDGIYYTIEPEYTGIFKLSVNDVVPENASAEVTVIYGGAETKADAETGMVELPIDKLTPIVVGVKAAADSEGNIPAISFALHTYIARILAWDVTEVPANKSTEQIGAGESIYYDVSGVPGEELVIKSENVCVVYDGEIYEPVDGQVNVPFAYEDLDQTDRIEIQNRSEDALSVSMEIIHPVGHILNPEILTALDEHTAYSRQNVSSYYFRYTAEANGYVSFVVWEDPTVSGATVEIELVNDKEETGAKLSDSNNGSVCVYAAAGNTVTVHVFVMDENGNPIDDTVIVKGELTGMESNPVMVQAPGFTADIPAGTTLYYGGYNLNNMILSLTGEDVTVLYGNMSYTPAEGNIRFQFADEESQTVFGIRNEGEENASYEVELLYPVGHNNNPDTLILGNNTVTQSKPGKDDYCYTFTAPRDGMLILTFDENAQWLYTVNNLTSGECGDTQYSDLEEPQPKTSLSVQAGDEIQIMVNTYDKDDPWSTPAGQVVFTAEYVTGPIEVPEATTGTEAELLAGEYMIFYTSLYSHTLVIKKGTGFSVIYGGTEYAPDANGQIRVEFATAGTEPFNFVIRSNGTETATCTFSISENVKGSQSDPIIAQSGTNTVTQVAGGSDIYFSFTNTGSSRLKVTITNTSDVYMVYVYNGNRVSLAPGATSSVLVRLASNKTVEFAINTYDPANTDVAPAGTISFTLP